MAPGHRQEVALALQAQRAELLSVIGNRGDARGVPQDVLEEVVNDAICVVVMMRKPVRTGLDSMH